MPTALLDSQFATLQPLGPDEAGVAVDVSGTPEEITERAVAALRAMRPAGRLDPVRPTALHRSTPFPLRPTKGTAVTSLSVEMLAADAVEPITSAGHAQLGIAVLAGIAVIVLLITKFKLHAFLSLTIGSLALGAFAGAPLDKAITSFTAGPGHDGRGRRAC